jgi:hypothetical protein
MKAFLILWSVMLVSCIDAPPRGAMGDGATNQFGLVNVTNHTMGAPQKAPKPVVTILDNGAVIQYPKR